MSYIPKSAQEKIDALKSIPLPTLATAAAVIVAHAEIQQVIAQLPVAPRRMEVGVTPQDVCSAYDVYLNGRRQSLCLIADVDKGFVRRYIHGVGNRPCPDRHGHMNTEIKFGRVHIVRKLVKVSRAKS